MSDNQKPKKTENELYRLGYMILYLVEFSLLINLSTSENGMIGATSLANIFGCARGKSSLMKGLRMRMMQKLISTLIHQCLSR